MTRHRSHANDDADIGLKLTSMIDVVFLLLIYFVVTASFAPREGAVIANLPGAGPPIAEPKPEPHPLRIRLTSAGATGYRITIAEAGLGAENFIDLQNKLVQLQHNPARGRRGVFRPKVDRVEIEPDGRVRWAHVVNAYNAAIAAEYENIALRAAVQ